MLAMAGVCVAIGLAPALVLAGDFARGGMLASGLGRRRTSAAAGHVGLGAPGLTLAADRWRRCLPVAEGARPTDFAANLTWDCGYAAPIARMQYSSGSFAGIAAGWFGWILRPERKLRRPRGQFPGEAIRLEAIPETVLERVIGPIGMAIMQVSTAVRRLQHGRLQFYILYVFAGLVALGSSFCWEACHDARSSTSSSVSRCWLLLAPLLPGIINKVKAWVAGRRGPPVLQLYYDLARLWRKGVVMSTLASPAFITACRRCPGSPCSARPC